MTNKELENKVNELEKELKEIKKKLQPNKKITLKEFWESEQKLAIHCDTEEEAKTLLSAFDKMGKKWNSGNRYTEFNNWSNCGQKIVYYNDGTYGNLRDIDSNVCMVYKFENVDLTIPKEYQFSENEKTILKSIDKKWKWIARDEDGKLFLFTDKPKKDNNSWQLVNFKTSYTSLKIFEFLFKSIQWTDDEPVEIAKVIGE